MSIASTSNEEGSCLKFESLDRPPSAVLEDGRFVYRNLAPINSASFFRRSVAKFNLIKAEGEQQQNDDENDIDTEKSTSSPIGAAEDKKIDDGDQPEPTSPTSTIHPIQIASARIHTHGISELSKAINLSSLIHSNEYFGLTTVIDKTARTGNAISDTNPTTGNISTTVTGSTETSTASTPTTSNVQNVGNLPLDRETHNDSQNLDTKIIDNDQQEDQTNVEQKLRSQYILKRKQAQFESASHALHSHYKRLKVVTTTQHTIDSRLLELRKRWRLNAPNHGINVEYPIQPTDVIAVDVDIYARRDNSYDYHNVITMGSGNDNKSSSSVLGRIARTVPTYATIELSNDYDIHKHIKLYHKHHGHHRHHHKHHQHGDDSNHNLTTSKNNDKTSTCSGGHDTVAEPFITESSSPWNNFQRNVPMLTLLFQIEKSSTGFKQKVCLSSNIEENEHDIQTLKQEEPQQTPTDNQNITKSIIESKTKLQKDELFIQSLQHSLFCANIFDIIRKEVINEQPQQQHQTNQTLKSHSIGTSTNAKRKPNPTIESNSISSRQQIAWLSSEMEDSFLPPPSLMAGCKNDDNDDDILNNQNSKSALAVIHCHEGEVKVQLDPEYSLTIKLVDINNNDIEKQEEEREENDYMGSRMSSGSQSPEQLHILCRLLLLQAQLVYHRSRKEQNRKIQEELASLYENSETAPSIIDYSAGMRKKGSVTTSQNPGPMTQRNKLLQSSISTPRILQSCVGLGKKFILERKVRKTLKVCDVCFELHFPLK